MWIPGDRSSTRGTVSDHWREWIGTLSADHNCNQRDHLQVKALLVLCLIFNKLLINLPTFENCTAKISRIRKQKCSEKVKN